MLWRIARQSLWHRRTSTSLIVLALTLAFAVLLTVEHIRHEVRATFQGTVSGVDLIVGARTGSTNLLLYSLFGIGNPSANISAASLQALRQQKGVEWVVPLSMGDSHRGFRVVATEKDFFARFHYGQRHPLEWQQGQAFAGESDVVLGAAVAQALGYSLGAEVILAHGQGRTSFTHHNDHPFHVVGILKPTGTPIDQTLLIDLDGMEHMHKSQPSQATNSHRYGHPAVQAANAHDADEHNEHSADEHNEHSADEHTEHSADEHNEHSADEHDKHSADEHGEHSADEHDEHSADEHNEHSADEHDEHDGVSAALVGLTQRPLAFKLQRFVNEYPQEALMAILPGLELALLWENLGWIESSLRAIALLVLASSILGMMTLLLLSIRQRQTELATLRSLGASPWTLFVLIEMEVLLISGLALILATVSSAAGLQLASHWLTGVTGIGLGPLLENVQILPFTGLLLAVCLLAAAIPAWRASRTALFSQLHSDHQ